MMRPIGWPKALREYAAAVRGAPFAWGTTDCATVVRGAIEIILGEDPWAGKYTYSSERGARRSLKRAESFCVALEAAGAVSVRPSFALQGDVLVAGHLVDDSHPAELAVVVGSGVLSSSVPDGVYWRDGIARWTDAPWTPYRLPGGSGVGCDG